MELPLIGRRNYLNPILEFSAEFNVNQTIEVTQKFYNAISALRSDSHSLVRRVIRWSDSHSLVGEY